MSTRHPPAVTAPPHSSSRYAVGPGRSRDCACGRAGCYDSFAALAATTDPAARATLRGRLIEAHLHLAYGIAGRYSHTGPGYEDVRQVAALALVEAVNRFDPGLGRVFTAFAVPTITGSLKRHFRDHGWMLHPPRRIKELRLHVRTATDRLTQQLRHAPTVSDLAAHLDCSPQEICEALCTDDALRPVSIETPVGATDHGGTTLVAILGSPDAAYTHVENVETLRPALAELSERELRVVTMRFAGNLSQAQIAERLGCSQMQISRTLRAALDRLRRKLQRTPADGQRGWLLAATKPDPPHGTFGDGYGSGSEGT
jgi:RNA polymerase sigma-B factor